MGADAMAFEDGSVLPRPYPGTSTSCTGEIYAGSPALSDPRVGHPGSRPKRWQQAGADETSEGLEFEWISRTEHEAALKRLEEKIALLAVQKDYWWHKSLEPRDPAR
jgi:hypothetical protein